MSHVHISPPPFLTTHLANIALHKKLGLVFLLAEPQKTFGLTTVSELSLVHDQLAVARWMILDFLGQPNEIPRDPSPWYPIGAYHPHAIGNALAPREEIEAVGNLIAQIRNEFDDLEPRSFWHKHDAGYIFAMRVIAQIEACERHIRRCTDIIKLCAELLQSANGAPERARTLMSLGPEAECELMNAFGMMGIDGIGAVGYLTMKSAVTAPCIFAEKFLVILRDMIKPEAIQSGYTLP